MNVKELQELQDKSMKFLAMAYMLVKDNRYARLTFKQIMDELGLPHDDYNGIENYLGARSYIKRWSAGGIKGIFDVTHEGFIYVEDSILDGTITITGERYDDEAPEQEPETIHIKEEILKAKELRDEFLIGIYQAYLEGSVNMITMRPIAESMGLTEREAMNIEKFWTDAYVLERKSGGGWNGSLSINTWSIPLIEQAILAAENEEDDAVNKRGPNTDTIFKLEELRRIRLESISNNEVTIGWVKACEQAGIDPDTAKRHEPDLRERWYDATYT